MAAIAGLDVGTTSSKAVVYGEDGAVLGTGRAPTTWDVGPHGTQADAEALWRSAFDALSTAAETAGVPVRAVGVASMGESGVLTDAHERPLAPVIAWHDDRDGDEVDELAEQLGPEEFGGIAGKPLRGQFSLTKHRWLLRHRTLDPGRNAALRCGRLGGAAPRRGRGPRTVAGRPHRLARRGGTRLVGRRADLVRCESRADAAAGPGGSGGRAGDVRCGEPVIARRTADARRSRPPGVRARRPCDRSRSRAGLVGHRRSVGAHRVPSCRTAPPWHGWPPRESPPTRASSPAIGPCSEAPKVGWRKTAHSSCSAWGPTGWPGSTPPPSRAPWPGRRRRARIRRADARRHRRRGRTGRSVESRGRSRRRRGAGAAPGDGRCRRARGSRRRHRRMAAQRRSHARQGRPIRPSRGIDRRRSRRAWGRDAGCACRRCDRSRRTLGWPVTAGERTWFADERHAEVLRLLASEHRVESARLARHFRVSAESIRKDLAQLETRGLLRRVHGGAAPRPAPA